MSHTQATLPDLTLKPTAPLRLKDADREGRLFLNRILAAAGIIVGLSLVLIGRLVYLQVIGHDRYAMLARDNQVRIAPLVPTRGLIYDRRGIVLAENIPVYSLEIVPEQVPDLKATLAALSAIVELTPEEIEQFKQQLHRRKRFESIPVKLRLSELEVARLAVRRPFLRGVEIQARLIRHYPYGELVSHLVGYVGRINEQELKRLDLAEYRGTTHIGKVGVEQSYETLLHGHTGYAEIETNAAGRGLKVLQEPPPQSGADLYLSLDIELQKIAYDALGEHNGAVVAIDPQSGEVLALVSKPGFDPNPFVLGISQKDYQALLNSPERPLFDRALRGIYPPGSTIKPFVGLAGLHYGLINPHRRLYCPGFYQLPGVSHRYRDWRKGGHGGVDLKAAIVQSCDVYFYDLAHHLGIDRLHEFLSQFGFGRSSGIDLLGENPGILPSRKWKRQALGKTWYPGETVIAGIGQGYVKVTAVQLAKAVAVLANRGKIITPHVAAFERRPPHRELKRLFTDPAEGEVSTDPHHLDKIIDAMIGVVHSRSGTAWRISQGADYTIAGKTGTAQVFSVKQTQDHRNLKIKDKKLQDHALFIAFAPAEAPRIAVAVIAENAGHGGSEAAPVARQVIDYYLKHSQP
ncbi:MAG: penicillin-binding protein 2 [Methylohalobius sp.]|nr:penicillin-binding protein 2 [Methylohalobius sp.]